MMPEYSQATAKFTVSWPIATLASMHPAIAQHRASIAAICQQKNSREAGQALLGELSN